MTLIFNNIIVDGQSYTMNITIVDPTTGVSQTFTHMHTGNTEPTASDWNNFYEAVGVGGGGDPYISPIYGKRYKLPDDNSCYRLLDNNSNKNKRLYININSYDLDNDTKNEINQYLYTEAKKQFKDTYTNEDIDTVLRCLKLKMPEAAVFSKNIYISNNDKAILFDFEKFIFIDKYGNNDYNIDKSFTIKQLDNINKKLKINVGMYNEEPPEAIYQIEFFNDTYGDIIIHLFKFSNPQIRNGYNIICDKSINFINSRGALLGKQDVNNVIINDLLDDNEIPEFKLTNHELSHEQIDEIFMKDSFMILNRF